MGIHDGAVVGTTQLVNHGPASRKFNIVVLGDGYQQAQLPQFQADAQNFVRTLFATHPFDGMQSAFNVYRVDVISTDTGADDPVACGGTGGVAHTYFDASFCNSNVRRALVVSNATVIGVANIQVPAWHMLIVIVNSAVYGGTGGQVAVFSLAPGANEIALHEMGHTAFGLADEYECYAGCGVDVGHERFVGGEPLQVNVTANPNRDTIKWRDLIDPATAMPTTANANCVNCDPQQNPVAADTVGAFEGAYYYHCRAYRPQFNCRMRALNNPYCAVCARAIREALKVFLDDKPA